MKKFLSLALALVMALSLVTISAGATEYEDFTDKDEIQYEEAVAVLNRLGIITGYSEGDFRPEGELTRGAAAKIIVSLLIGPEAAEALPTTGNPYPDVPAGNVFAGYISFCKTQEIISGYGDGTFRPNGTLTGFAFAKMLLGALGYDSKIEGFEGSGWTMNVATLGNSTGLFDRLSFKGGDTVNRETACQLALNTLKATMVEYNGSGSTTVTIAGVPVDIGGTQKWSYKTSNQEFARNINRDTAANSSQYYTVEFGEEHFVDLKLEYDKNNPTADSFGRPSVEWSYKRVTIGTYPLEADYVYTTQVAHNVKDVSAASKINALGLGSYNTQVTSRQSSTGAAAQVGNTKLYVNGQLITSAMGPDHVDLIADYTDNGTEVDVYVSYEYAGLIDTVVVVQNQLMQIRSISSSAVALEMYDKDEADANNGIVNPLANMNQGNNRNYADGGYNLRENNWKVNDVEVGDKYFELLSGLKVGDLVVVEPVYAGAGTNEYDVGNVYVPETVTGAFTNVRGYGTTEDDRMAINVTVGGTQYPISQWSKDLNGVSGESLKITRGDVTLYLNKHGAAMLAKGIGDASDWMIIGNFRRTMVDNQIVTMVNGWDISGDPLELNLGPKANVTAGFHEGDLVKYSVNTTSSSTDWDLSFSDVYNVYTGTDDTLTNPAPYEIKANNSMVRMFGYPGRNGEVNGSEYKDSTGVKFIYVNFDTDGEVSSVDIRSGLQNATNADLKYSTCGDHWAQACVKVGDNGNNAVKAVVVKREATDGLISKLALILAVHDQATIRSGLTAQDATTSRYATGRVVYTYTAALLDATGKITDNVEIHSYDKLSRGDFVTYTARTVDGYENFYDLHTPLDTVGRNNITAQATMYNYVNADRGLIHAGDWRYLHDQGSGYRDTVKAVYGEATGSWMFPAVATNQGPAMIGSGEGSNHNILDLSRALWLDMTGNRISNSKDLKTWWNDHPGKSLGLRMVINDNPESDGFRTAYMVVIYSEITGRDTTDPVKYNSYASWEDIMDTEKPVKVPTTGDEVAPPADSASVKFVAADETVDLTTLTLDIKLNGESKTVAEIGAAELAAGDKVTFTIPNDYTATYTASDGATDTTKFATSGPVEITITEAMVSGKVAITVSIGKEVAKSGVFDYTAGGHSNAKTGITLDPERTKLTDGGLELAFNVDWASAVDSKGNRIPYGQSGGAIAYSVYLKNDTSSSPIYTQGIAATGNVDITQGMPRVVVGALSGSGINNLLESDAVYVKIDMVWWADVCVYYDGEGADLVDTSRSTAHMGTIYSGTPNIEVYLNVKSSGFELGDINAGSFNAAHVYVNGTHDEVEDNGGSAKNWTRPAVAPNYDAKLTLTAAVGSWKNALDGLSAIYVELDTSQLETYAPTVTVLGLDDGAGGAKKLNLIDGLEGASGLDDAYTVQITPADGGSPKVGATTSATVKCGALATSNPAAVLTLVAVDETTGEVDTGVTISPATVTATHTDAVTETVRITGVTKDVRITVGKVEILEGPVCTNTAFTQATANQWAASDTVTVYFDKELTAIDKSNLTGDGTDIKNPSAVALTADKMGLTITLDVGGSQNGVGGKIEIEAGKLVAADGSYNTSKITINFVADKITVS